MDVATAQVWADDLAGIGLQEALEAAREHYRESDKWLMPAHVAQRALKARKGDPLRESARLALEESRSARSRGVPMPSEYRDMVRRGLDG